MGEKGEFYDFTVARLLEPCFFCTGVPNEVDVAKYGFTPNGWLHH